MSSIAEPTATKPITFRRFKDGANTYSSFQKQFLMLIIRISAPHIFKVHRHAKEAVLQVKIFAAI